MRLLRLSRLGFRDMFVVRSPFPWVKFRLARPGLEPSIPMDGAWIKASGFQPLGLVGFLLVIDAIDGSRRLGRSGSGWRLYLCSLSGDPFV